MSLVQEKRKISITQTHGNPKKLHIKSGGTMSIGDEEQKLYKIKRKGTKYFDKNNPFNYPYKDYRIRMAEEALKLKPKNIIVVGGAWSTIPKILRMNGFKGTIETIEPNKKVTLLGLIHAPRNMGAIDKVHQMTAGQWAKTQEKGTKYDVALLDAYDGHKCVYTKEKYEISLKHLFKTAISNTFGGMELETWK